MDRLKQLPVLIQLNLNQGQNRLWSFFICLPQNHEKAPSFFGENLLVGDRHILKAGIRAVTTVLRVYLSGVGTRQHRRKWNRRSRHKAGARSAIPQRGISRQPAGSRLKRLPRRRIPLAIRRGSNCGFGRKLRIGIPIF